MTEKVYHIPKEGILSVTHKTITLRRIKSAVKKRVLDSPNFVYDTEFGCYYMRNGQPDCLIGCALVDLKVPRKCVAELDTAYSRHGGGSPCAVDDNEFLQILEKYDWKIDDDARVFMSTLQECQDDGKSWQKSYENALEEVQHVNS